MDGHVLRLRMNASHPHGGVVTINSEQRGKFADFELPSEDELRMPVEKYLLGAIDYAYVKPEPFNILPAGENSNCRSGLAWK
jgi:hypothetical protein